jgi:hypothetical protein
LAPKNADSDHLGQVCAPFGALRCPCGAKFSPANQHAGKSRSRSIGGRGKARNTGGRHRPGCSPCSPRAARVVLAVDFPAMTGRDGYLPLLPAAAARKRPATACGSATDRPGRTSSQGRLCIPDGGLSPILEANSSTGSDSIDGQVNVGSTMQYIYQCDCPARPARWPTATGRNQE